MMKRLVWFTAGTVAGAVGGLYGRHKAHEAAEKLAPTNVAKRTVVGVRDRGRDVVEAVREGRAAMRAREAELRATAEGHPVVTSSTTTVGPPGARQVVEVRVVEQLDDYRARRELPAAVPEHRVRRVRRRGRR
jgi:hypothetical protein